MSNKNLFLSSVFRNRPLSLLPTSCLTPTHSPAYRRVSFWQWSHMWCSGRSITGNLLEIQIHRHYPRLTESETLCPEISVLWAPRVILIFIWVWEPQYVLYNIYILFFTFCSLFFPQKPLQPGFALSSFSKLNPGSFILPICMLSQGALTRALVSSYTFLEGIETAYWYQDNDWLIAITSCIPLSKCQISPPVACSFHMFH